ncbi:scabin-related ADP-ribosyltransferase [Saccharopolyspora sp. NPDC002376]
MSLYIPPEHATAFAALTGSSWPEADEDQLRELSTRYHELAGKLGSLHGNIAELINAINQDFEGEAQQTFLEYVRRFIVKNDKGVVPLEAVVQAADAMSEFLFETAADVEYMKWQAIGQLILMAVEIAVAIAMAVPSAGLSLLKIPTIKMITSWILKLLLKLVAHTIISLAMELLFAVALDAAIQAQQLAAGTRRDWNHDLTNSALKGAAISGALGGIASMGANALGKSIFDKLAKHLPGGAAVKFSNPTVKDLWEKTAVSGLGSPVMGAHGVLSEGLTNYDENGSFDVNWYSFTGGAVMGFAEELGEHFIGDPVSDKLKNAVLSLGSPNGGSGGGGPSSGAGTAPSNSETSTLVDSNNTGEKWSPNSDKIGEFPSGDTGKADTSTSNNTGSQTNGSSPSSPNNTGVQTENSPIHNGSASNVSGVQVGSSTSQSGSASNVNGGHSGSSASHNGGASNNAGAPHHQVQPNDTGSQDENSSLHDESSANSSGVQKESSTPHNGEGQSKSINWWMADSDNSSDAGGEFQNSTDSNQSTSDNAAASNEPGLDNARDNTDDFDADLIETNEPDDQGVSQQQSEDSGHEQQVVTGPHNGVAPPTPVQTTASPQPVPTTTPNAQSTPKMGGGPDLSGTPNTAVQSPPPMSTEASPFGPPTSNPEPTPVVTSSEPNQHQTGGGEQQVPPQEQENNAPTEGQEEFGLEPLDHVLLDNDLAGLNQQANTMAPEAYEALNDELGAGNDVSAMPPVLDQGMTIAEQEWNPGSVLEQDLFGLLKPADSFVPTGSYGPGFENLTAQQGIHLLEQLDLAHADDRDPGDLTPQGLVNSSVPVATYNPTAQQQQWAPASVTPLPKQLEMPHVRHSIWLGGPITDLSSSARGKLLMQSNLELSARNLGAQGKVVLWTDVPRGEFAHPTTPAVHEMKEWAKENGVILANVHEVFDSAAPMKLQEPFLSETVKGTKAGYAAASDILRMELLKRFGGVYSDGEYRTGQDYFADAAQVATSGPGYGVHVHGRNGDAGNDLFVMAKGHPFADFYLDHLGANYLKTQSELIPEFQQNLDRNGSPAHYHDYAINIFPARRHPVMYLTGPNAMDTMAGELGLENVKQFPKSPSDAMRSGSSWNSPESTAPTVGLDDVPATIAMTKNVIQTLVSELHSRDGDLHLTLVDELVSKHEQPAVIWTSALGYLASHPDLANLVTSVTDVTTVSNEGGGFHEKQVVLPEKALRYLNFGGGDRSHSLAEFSRPATMVQPNAAGTQTSAGPSHRKVQSTQDNDAETLTFFDGDDTATTSNTATTSANAQASSSNQNTVARPSPAEKFAGEQLTDFDNVLSVEDFLKDFGKFSDTPKLEVPEHGAGSLQEDFQQTLRKIEELPDDVPTSLVRDGFIAARNTRLLRVFDVVPGPSSGLTRQQADQQLAEKVVQKLQLGDEVAQQSLVEQFTSLIHNRGAMGFLQDLSQGKLFQVDSQKLTADGIETVQRDMFLKLEFTGVHQAEADTNVQQKSVTESSLKFEQSIENARKTAFNGVIGAVLSAAKAIIGVTPTATFNGERGNKFGTRYSDDVSGTMKISSAKKVFAVDAVLHWEDVTKTDGTGNTGLAGQAPLGTALVAYPKENVGPATDAVRNGIPSRSDSVELPTKLTELVAAVDMVKLGDLHKHVLGNVPDHVRQDKVLWQNLSDSINAGKFEESSAQSLPHGFSITHRSEHGQLLPKLRFWQNTKPAEVTAHFKPKFRGYEDLGPFTGNVGTDSRNTLEDLQESSTTMGAEPGIRIGGADEILPNVQIVPTVHIGAGATSKHTDTNKVAWSTKQKLLDTEAPMRLIRLDTSFQVDLETRQFGSTKTSTQDLGESHGGAYYVAVEESKYQALIDELDAALRDEKPQLAEPTPQAGLDPQRAKALRDAVSNDGLVSGLKYIEHADQVFDKTLDLITGHLEKQGVELDAAELRDLKRQLYALNARDLAAKFNRFTHHEGEFPDEPLKLTVNHKNRHYKITVDGVLGDVLAEHRKTNLVSTGTSSYSTSKRERDKNTIGIRGTLSALVRARLSSAGFGRRNYVGAGVTVQGKGDLHKLGGHLSAFGHEDKVKYTGPGSVVERGVTFHVQVQETLDVNLGDRLKKVVAKPSDLVKVAQSKILTDIGAVDVDAVTGHQVPEFLINAQSELTGGVPLHGDALAEYKQQNPNAFDNELRGGLLVWSHDHYQQLNGEFRNLQTELGNDSKLWLTKKYGNAGDLTRQWFDVAEQSAGQGPQTRNSGSERGYLFDRRGAGSIEFKYFNPTPLGPAEGMTLQHVNTSEKAVHEGKGVGAGFDLGLSALFGVGEFGVSFGYQAEKSARDTHSGAGKVTSAPTPSPVLLYKADQLATMSWATWQELWGQSSNHGADFAPKLVKATEDHVEVLFPNSAVLAVTEEQMVAQGLRPPEGWTPTNVERVEKPDGVPVLDGLGQGLDKDVKVVDFTPDASKSPNDPKGLADWAKKTVAEHFTKLAPHTAKGTRPPAFDAIRALNGLNSTGAIRAILNGGWTHSFTRGNFFSGSTRYTVKVTFVPDGNPVQLVNHPTGGSAETSGSSAVEYQGTRSTKVNAGLIARPMFPGGSGSTGPAVVAGGHLSDGVEVSNTVTDNYQHRSRTGDAAQFEQPGKFKIELIKVSKPALLVSELTNGHAGSKYFRKPDLRTVHIDDTFTGKVRLEAPEGLLNSGTAAKSEGVPAQVDPETGKVPGEITDEVRGSSSFHLAKVMPGDLAEKVGALIGTAGTRENRAFSPGTEHRAKLDTLLSADVLLGNSHAFASPDGHAVKFQLPEGTRNEQVQLKVKMRFANPVHDATWDLPAKQQKHDQKRATDYATTDEQGAYAGFGYAAMQPPANNNAAIQLNYKGAGRDGNQSSFKLEGNEKASKATLERFHSDVVYEIEVHKQLRGGKWTKVDDLTLLYEKSAAFDVDTADAAKFLAQQQNAAGDTRSTGGSANGNDMTFWDGADDNPTNTDTLTNADELTGGDQELAAYYAALLKLADTNDADAFDAMVQSLQNNLPQPDALTGSNESLNLSEMEFSTPIQASFPFGSTKFLDETSTKVLDDSNGKVLVESDPDSASLLSESSKSSLPDMALLEERLNRLKQLNLPNQQGQSSQQAQSSQQQTSGEGSNEILNEGVRSPFDERSPVPLSRDKAVTTDAGLVKVGEHSVADLDAARKKLVDMIADAIPNDPANPLTPQEKVALKAHLEKLAAGDGLNGLLGKKIWLSLGGGRNLSLDLTPNSATHLANLESGSPVQKTVLETAPSTGASASHAHKLGVNLTGGVIADAFTGGLFYVLPFAGMSGETANNVGTTETESNLHVRKTRFSDVFEVGFDVRATLHQAGADSVTMIGELPEKVQLAYPPEAVGTKATDAPLHSLRSGRQAPPVPVGAQNYIVSVAGYTNLGSFQDKVLGAVANAVPHASGPIKNFADRLSDAGLMDNYLRGVTAQLSVPVSGVVPKDPNRPAFQKLPPAADAVAQQVRNKLTKNDQRIDLKTTGDVHLTAFQKVSTGTIDAGTNRRRNFGFTSTTTSSGAFHFGITARVLETFAKVASALLPVQFGGNLDLSMGASQGKSSSAGTKSYLKEKGFYSSGGTQYRLDLRLDHTTSIEIDGKARPGKSPGSDVISAYVWVRDENVTNFENLLKAAMDGVPHRSPLPEGSDLTPQQKRDYKTLVGNGRLTDLRNLHGAEQVMANALRAVDHVLITDTSLTAAERKELHDEALEKIASLDPVKLVRETFKVGTTSISTEVDLRGHKYAVHSDQSASEALEDFEAQLAKQGIQLTDDEWPKIYQQLTENEQQRARDRDKHAHKVEFDLGGKKFEVSVTGKPKDIRAAEHIEHASLSSTRGTDVSVSNSIGNEISTSGLLSGRFRIRNFAAGLGSRLYFNANLGGHARKSWNTGSAAGSSAAHETKASYRGPAVLLQQNLDLEVQVKVSGKKVVANTDTSTVETVAEYLVPEFKAAHAGELHPGTTEVLPAGADLSTLGPQLEPGKAMVLSSPVEKIDQLFQTHSKDLQLAGAGEQKSPWAKLPLLGGSKFHVLTEPSAFVTAMSAAEHGPQLLAKGTKPGFWGRYDLVVSESANVKLYGSKVLGPVPPGALKINNANKLSSNASFSDGSAKGGGVNGQLGAVGIDFTAAYGSDEGTGTTGSHSGSLKTTQEVAPGERLVMVLAHAVVDQQVNAGQHALHGDVLNPYPEQGSTKTQSYLMRDSHVLVMTERDAENWINNTYTPPPGGTSRPTPGLVDLGKSVSADITVQQLTSQDQQPLGQPFLDALAKHAPALVRDENQVAVQQIKQLDHPAVQQKLLNGGETFYLRSPKKWGGRFFSLHVWAEPAASWNQNSMVRPLTGSDAITENKRSTGTQHKISSTKSKALTAAFNALPSTPDPAVLTGPSAQVGRNKSKTTELSTGFAQQHGARGERSGAEVEVDVPVTLHYEIKQYSVGSYLYETIVPSYFRKMQAEPVTMPVDLGTVQATAKLRMPEYLLDLPSTDNELQTGQQFTSDDQDVTKAVLASKSLQVVKQNLDGVIDLTADAISGAAKSGEKVLPAAQRFAGPASPHRMQLEKLFSGSAMLSNPKDFMAGQVTAFLELAEKFAASDYAVGLKYKLANPVFQTAVGTSGGESLQGGVFSSADTTSKSTGHLYGFGEVTMQDVGYIAPDAVNGRKQTTTKETNDGIDLQGRTKHGGEIRYVYSFDVQYTATAEATSSFSKETVHHQDAVRLGGQVLSFTKEEAEAMGLPLPQSGQDNAHVEQVSDDASQVDDDDPVQDIQQLFVDELNTKPVENAQPEPSSNPSQDDDLVQGFVGGKPVYFNVGEVKAHELRSKNGELIGISFVEGDSLQDIKKWAAAAESAPTTNYSVPSSDRDLVNKAVQTPDSAAQYLQSVPWNSDRSPFVVNAHATDKFFTVTHKDGSKVKLTGDAFAKVVSNSTLFTANQNRDYQLLACSSGKLNEPGGSAYDFQQAIAQFGHGGAVYAPSSAVGTKLHGSTPITALADGGTWNTFGDAEPTPPAPETAPKNTTPDATQQDSGQSVRWYQDGSTTDETPQDVGTAPVQNMEDAVFTALSPAAQHADNTGEAKDVDPVPTTTDPEALQQPPFDGKLNEFLHEEDISGGFVQTEPGITVFRWLNEHPALVAKYGLQPKDASYCDTIKSHVTTTGRSQYVSTTTDPGYRHNGRRYRYEFVAPRPGIDIQKTFKARDIKWMAMDWEREVAFLDTIPQKDIVEVTEVDDSGAPKTVVWSAKNGPLESNPLPVIRDIKPEGPSDESPNNTGKNSPEFLAEQLVEAEVRAYKVEHRRAPDLDESQLAAFRERYAEAFRNGGGPAVDKVQQELHQALNGKPADDGDSSADEGPANKQPEQHSPSEGAAPEVLQGDWGEPKEIKNEDGEDVGYFVQAQNSDQVLLVDKVGAAHFGTWRAQGDEVRLEFLHRNTGREEDADLYFRELSYQPSTGEISLIGGEVKAGVLVRENTPPPEGLEDAEIKSTSDGTQYYAKTDADSFNFSPMALGGKKKLTPDGYHLAQESSENWLAPHMRDGHLVQHSADGRWTRTAHQNGTIEVTAADVPDTALKAEVINGGYTWLTGTVELATTPIGKYLPVEPGIDTSAAYGWTSNQPPAAPVGSNVPVDLIHPRPVVLANPKLTFRVDRRSPNEIISSASPKDLDAPGFRPRNMANTSLAGHNVSLIEYSAGNAGSMYVAATLSRHFKIASANWRYWIFAPGGIDLNKTLSFGSKKPHEREITFAGGVDQKFIMGYEYVGQKEGTFAGVTYRSGDIVLNAGAFAGMPPEYASRAAAEVIEAEIDSYLEMKSKRRAVAVVDRNGLDAFEEPLRKALENRDTAEFTKVLAELREKLDRQVTRP